MKVTLFHGKAVKMLAKFTDTILVSFQDAKGRIPNAKKVVLTGTPMKINDENLKENQRKEILKQLDLDDKSPIVLIFGGSQGAKKINEAVIELLSEKHNLTYQLVLVSGQKQYDNVINAFKDKNINISKMDNVKIFPYIYNIEDIEKVASLLVCRSGANTIAEISAFGKPAIFVPLPNVSNDHQTFNAKVLENVNAAKIIKNDELTGKKLGDMIDYMINDKSKLESMGNNAKKIAITDAQDRIYKEIIELLYKK